MRGHNRPASKKRQMPSEQGLQTGFFAMKIYGALTSPANSRSPGTSFFGLTASELQSFSPYRRREQEWCKEGSVATSARPRIAEQDNWSRRDNAHLRLVVAIGVIAVVATVCLVVAVLTSARRADEASLDRERQLIAQAIADRGARLLREVKSVAATPGAAQAIRLDYDPQWIERHIGKWLEDFFDDDVVVVVDGFDRIEYINQSINRPTYFLTRRIRIDSVGA